MISPEQHQQYVNRNLWSSHNAHAIARTMTEREGANIYEEFKNWLRSRIVYEENTAYPLTYRQITKHFPRRSECSAEVLATLIEEMNDGEAAFTALEMSPITPCYRNLRTRTATTAF